MRKLLLLLLAIAALIVTIISIIKVKPEDIANESPGMGWAGVDIGEKISAEDAYYIYNFRDTIFGLNSEEYEFYAADRSGCAGRLPSSSFP